MVNSKLEFGYATYFKAGQKYELHVGTDEYRSPELILNSTKYGVSSTSRDLIYNRVSRRITVSFQACAVHS